MNLFKRLLNGFFLCLMLTACQDKETIPAPKTDNAFNMQPIAFTQLPHWQDDPLIEAWPAWIRSCGRASGTSSFKTACAAAQSMVSPTEMDVRHYFETYFTPYQVKVGDNAEGLFTGYYEVELEGSRTKKGSYTAPIYKRPADLVMIEDLGRFRSDLKGIRIAGKVINGNLQPYYTHAEIDQGALAGNELVWIESPIDAFFAQIQGSAVIRLEKGEIIRINYAGTNGHPYTAIGKVLIDQKELTRKNVSMQTIRAWLENHPDKANALMEQNESYVFFREVEEGPLGAQGVVLTPERSIAVDPTFIAYGTPIWLDITHPMAEEARIQRLVIAQDKGGAVKGAIRGDLFWGTGMHAGIMAGMMKSPGSYYVLLPNERG